MRSGLRLVATVLILALGVVGFAFEVSAEECLLGEIKWFAGNFVPRAYAACDGAILSIAQNTALFSLLGTNYGGNGTTTFALPDLRSRVMIGVGQGAGLSNYAVGESGGAESVTLSVAQMPQHTHTLKAINRTASSSSPLGKALAKTKAYKTGVVDTTLSAQSVGSAGGSQPFEIVPPYLGLTPIICIQGIFPSRN